MNNYELDSAYMAGILDGEGSIHANVRNYLPNNNPLWSLEISVGNNSLDAIEPFVTRYGGKIYNFREKCHSWYCPSAEKFRVLVELLPYLRVKKAQAELAVEFLNLPQEFRGCYADNTEIKEAKRELAVQLWRMNGCKGKKIYSYIGGD